MALMQDRLLVVIDAASEGAVRELKELEGSAKNTGSSITNLGKSLKTGLVAGAAALVGTGLVSFLNDSAQAFVESQQAALQFGRATNATVEEAGKFTMVAKQLGLDMNDLIEINAEFSKKIQEQPQLLADIGVEISKNADGSTNMTRTLVETIDALGGMEDGLKAAQTAATLFGEEGSKQLAGFYLQGIDVADLMDRIDFIDRSEDAKRYAASTLEMNLAMEQLQVTIGAKVVPIMTDLADAASGVFQFLAQIPDSAYLVAAAAGAWYVAQKYLNAELVVTVGLQLFESITNAADAFLVAEGTAGKARVALAGFNTVAGFATRTILPLAAAFATLEAINFRNIKGDELSAFAVQTDNIGKSLATLAEEAGNTDSVMNTLFTNITAAFTPGITIADQEIFNMVTALKDLAESTLASADATEAQKEAAREYLRVQGEGSIEQRAANLATDEGTEAIARLTAASQGLADIIASDVALSFDSLEEAVADFVLNGDEASVTMKDIAQYASDAALAQKQQEEVTRLTAEALAIASGDAEYFLARLKDLENIGGSSVEGIKASLQGLDFKDVADTWANEALISAERAYDTIVDGLIAAVEENPQLDLSGWLDQFRGFKPELDAVIDQVLADAGADTQLTAALEVAKGESVDTTLAEVDALGNPIVGTFDLTTGLGVAAATAAKEGLAAPIETTLIMETEFAPGGYMAVKKRKDYLAEAIETTLVVDVDFEPGTYEDVKARKDYIAADRTATISVVLDEYSAQSVLSRLRQIQSSASIQATVAQQATIPQSPEQQLIQPIVNNSLRVNLDGQQLRGVVREEIRYGSSSTGTAVP